MMNPLMKPPSDEELANQLLDLLDSTHWEVPEELHGINWKNLIPKMGSDEWLNSFL